MILKKKIIVALFFIGFLIFPFYSARAEFTCLCMRTTATHFAGCVADETACKTECLKYGAGITMIQPVDCGDKPCITGKVNNGGTMDPIVRCGTCAENSSIIDCQGDDAEKVEEYIPPEVVLEVPFGSEGTTASPVVGLDGYIAIFYNFVVAVIAIAAVIMIMFGGFKWATAAGNSSMVASAKQTITNAIIGLVLALTSFLLLYTINPALVSIKTFQIPFVSMGGGSISAKCQDVPNIENVSLYHTANDTQMLKAGGTGNRPSDTKYCSTGTVVPEKFGGGGSVTINPKICEAIAVAAKALADTGSKKKLCVGPIVGGHYKCSSGCSESCTISQHFNGNAVDIYFRPKGGNARCGGENALTYDETIAVFNAIKSLSPSQTIACFPGQGTDGCNGTCGILPGASTVVSLQCGHDDHIHLSF